MIDPSALDLARLKADLIRDEGLRLKAYDDATGAPPVLKGNLTIGIGHNLTANGLSPAIVDAIYESDIADVVRALSYRLGWWQPLGGARKRALANWAFNIGVDKLLTEFKPTLCLIANGDYQEAAEHMRNSLWAQQVGARAQRLALLVERGEES